MYWIISRTQSMGNRFVVVDAINKEKVINFYERNGFKIMFRTEKEEIAATGKQDVTTLSTRMMFADLKNYTINV